MISEDNQVVKLPISKPDDLTLTSVFSIASAIAIIALPGGNPLRVVLGVPLLLFFPGYSLVSLLWPEKNNLDYLERIVLAIGFSVVVISIMGLAIVHSPLNFNHWGITVSALFIIILFSILAMHRRLSIPPERRYVLHIREIISSGGIKSEERLVAVGLSLVIVVSCLGIGYLVSSSTPGEYYSEFYVLDANGTTENYPLNISINEIGHVRIGIISHEAGITNYSLFSGSGNRTEVTIVDNGTDDLAFKRDTWYSRGVVLEPGSSLTDDFSFYFIEPGIYKFQWLLVKEGGGTEYDIHLWITVNE